MLSNLLSWGNNKIGQVESKKIAADYAGFVFLYVIIFTRCLTVNLSFVLIHNENQKI